MRSAKYFLYSNLDSTLLSVMSHKISIPKLKSYLDTIESLFEVSEPIFLKYGLTFDCFYSLGELLYQDNRINSITYELFLRFFKNSRFGRHYEMFIRSFLNRDPKNPKEKINIRILNDA